MLSKMRKTNNKGFTLIELMICQRHCVGSL
ncbi:MAG: prepilin-type N-terminal cleavage/methylation domain-containing protein [Desulfosarcina sp.]|nr:prepilin-type N-terminal cleavage/methylation domain-containing protein [Desulfosarcina sp.]